MTYTMTFATKRSTLRATAFVALVILGMALVHPSAAAQEEAYSDLWESGEYHQALEVLETRIARYSGFIPTRLATDYAELLFTVGRVDEAISQLETVLDRYEEPAYAVRLAEMLHYGGRTEQYRAMVERARVICQMAIRYGISAEGFLALARVDEMSGRNPKEIFKRRYEFLQKERPEFVEGYIAAANLAYEHYGYDVAAEKYRIALEKDRDNQDALIGLARCYHKSGDPRLNETLEELEAINPHHFGIHEIRARKALDRGDAEDALKHIEEVLVVKPNELTFLSLKAAAHWLQDDFEGMKAAQKRALDFNPNWSEAYAIPGHVAERRYRFQEAEALSRQALQIDPDDSEAKAQLAFAILRQGRNKEGKELLEQVYDEDPYHVQAVNMLTALDSLDTFVEIEDGPFVLELPEYEARLMSDEVLNLLHDGFDRYTEKYDAELDTPIYVQMFDDHDEFMVRSIGLPGNAGHLGICFGHLVTLDSPRARPPRSTNWKAVLWHEFVHVITLQKTNNRMPRWLSEGISIYEEKAGDESWGQPLEMQFYPIIKEDDWPTMEGLEAYFTAPKSSAHLMYGYFAAGEFVHFYVDAYGMEAIVEVLDAIGSGADTVEALIDASGVTREEINEGFATHMETRCAALEYLPEPPEKKEGEEGMMLQTTPWHSQPSPFTDALKGGQEAAQAGDYDKAIELLNEAFEMYPEYQGQNGPLRQLAAVYKEQGATAKYVETLERILDHDTTPFGPAMALAEHYAEQGAWEDVLRTARVGFAIDPFDVRVREHMLEAAIALGETDAAIHALGDLAYLDETRSTDYQLKRARLMAESGDSSRAKAETIALLEELPHFWEAQELLLEIVEGADEDTTIDSP